MSGVKINDSGIEHLKELTSLETLVLPSGRISGRITDKGMKALSGLSSLKSLRAESNAITHQGVKELVGLSDLRELSLAGPGITNASAGLLSTLHRLEELSLNDCAITDQGMKHIAEIKSLKSLHLIHMSRVTGKGIACLGELSSLQNLYLWNMPLKDEDLGFLARLLSLKHLYIDSNTLSDSILKSLLSLTSLSSLSLPEAKLTDRGLIDVGQLGSLEYLNIAGDFTEDGIKKLYSLSKLYSLTLSGNQLSPESLTDLERNLPSLMYLRTPMAEHINKKPAPGDIAPAFRLDSTDGNLIDLKSLRGRVVLLHFWATWCTPCVANTPSLKRLHDRLKDDENFSMISLSLDEKSHLVQRHVEQFGLDWPQICLGNNSDVITAYGIYGVPVYFVIDRDGKIITHTIRDYTKLENVIRKTLRTAK